MTVLLPMIDPLLRCAGPTDAVLFCSLQDGLFGQRAETVSGVQIFRVIT